MKVFLQSTQDPKIRFEVLTFNKKTSMAKLRSDSSEFTEPLTKERMNKYGYRLEKVEE